VNKGDPVQILTSGLGATANPGGFRFVSGVSTLAGDSAVYFKSLPDVGPDWHMLTIRRGGNVYYVPCRDSDFREVG
jgi:hypothetical protein